MTANNPTAAQDGIASFNPHVPTGVSAGSTWTDLLPPLPEGTRLTHSWADYIDLHLRVLEKMERLAMWRVILFTTRKGGILRKALARFGTRRQARSAVGSMLKAKAELATST